MTYMYMWIDNVTFDKQWKYAGYAAVVIEMVSKYDWINVDGISVILLV